MSLKDLAMENIVDMIKSLPPLLQEEVIGETRKSIKNEVKNEVIQEFKNTSSFVIEDLTQCLTSGNTFKRSSYSIDIDDDLFYTYMYISERFVHNYGEYLFPKTDCYIPPHMNYINEDY